MKLSTSFKSILLMSFSMISAVSNAALYKVKKIIFLRTDSGVVKVTANSKVEDADIAEVLMSINKSTRLEKMQEMLGDDVSLEYVNFEDMELSSQWSGDYTE